jgi:hypothetical protein
MRLLLAAVFLVAVSAEKSKAIPLIMNPLAMQPVFFPFGFPQFSMMHQMWGQPHYNMYPHAGRPLAPQSGQIVPPPSISGAAVDLVDSQQAQTQTETSTASLMGTMSQLSTKAAVSTHNYLVPPYSWALQLGMMGAQAMNPNIAQYTQVPEFLNLISGYFAGSPDAMNLVNKASRGEIDPFSIPRHTMFGSPRMQYTPSSIMPSMARSSTDFDDDDDDDDVEDKVNKGPLAMNSPMLSFL